MPLIYRIAPFVRGWRLSLDDGALVLEASTFEPVERRARFLAVRAEVRDLACEIRVQDASGAEVGVWRGERFEPAAHTPRLAA